MSARSDLQPISYANRKQLCKHLEPREAGQGQLLPAQGLRSQGGGPPLRTQVQSQPFGLSSPGLGQITLCQERPVLTGWSLPFFAPPPSQREWGNGVGFLFICLVYFFFLKFSLLGSSVSDRFHGFTFSKG